MTFSLFLYLYFFQGLCFGLNQNIFLKVRKANFNVQYKLFTVIQLRQAGVSYQGMAAFQFVGVPFSERMKIKKIGLYFLIML